jgi:hypothetical protein
MQEHYWVTCARDQIVQAHAVDFSEEALRRSGDLGNEPHFNAGIQDGQMNPG